MIVSIEKTVVCISLSLHEARNPSHR